MPVDDIHIGMLVASSPATDDEDLERFTRRIVAEVAPRLEQATGVSWAFHPEQRTHLPTEHSRRPSDFMAEASLRMVEGPYDAVLVVTDVGLISERRQLVPGLASTIARVVVISTRDFRISPRGEPVLPLDDPQVHWNAAALLLHLICHLAGLEHTSGSPMDPFFIDPARRDLPPLNAKTRDRLTMAAREFPSLEDDDQGFLHELLFHLRSAARHPGLIAKVLVRSRALLLPLHLPRLSTAAVAPAFILVFTAEIWDAGFHMTNSGVWALAAISLLASAIYLPFVLNLFLPRKENRRNTEHLATVNVTILLSMMLAVLGLFAMLMLLMLSIQTLIFPPDLIREWPSLDLASRQITLVDQFRIAALISTIGVLTGSLAGGLESRDILRHLALFRRKS